MWTYSINDASGREIAHGDECTVLNLHRERLDAGQASHLVMWRPGARSSAAL